MVKIVRNFDLQTLEKKIYIHTLMRFRGKQLDHQHEPWEQEFYLSLRTQRVKIVDEMHV